MNVKINKICRSIVLLALIGFASCTEPVSPPEPLAKTHTIQELLNHYMTDLGVYFPVRTRSYHTEAPGSSEADNYGLFSIDSIPAHGTDVVIEGRIVSDDNTGNLYKTMVIQDSEHPEQGFRISLDAGSLSGIYTMGQLVRIRCNGLAIGKYAFQPQLCLPSYNNNVNASNSHSKIGWAPGRIPFPIFKQAVEVVGLPEPSKIVVDTLEIPEILNITSSLVGLGNSVNIKEDLTALKDDIQAMNGRLVCIKNVHFTWQYEDRGKAADCTTGDPETDGNTYCFAPTTGNQGFPQGRYIADDNGNKILISTSEYAKFAHFILPATDCVGNVTGIVSFYYDRAKYGLDGGEWGITIRSLDDLQLFDSEGKLWERKEWTKQ